jgi:hypothetical protein
MSWSPWFQHWFDYSDGHPYRPMYVLLSREQMDDIDIDAWIAAGGGHHRVHESAPGGAIRAFGRSTELARMPPGVRWHRSEDPFGMVTQGVITFQQFMRMSRA